MYRLKPLINRKLYIIITTMPKNTIARRITIGPVNTFNSKTATILNL